MDSERPCDILLLMLSDILHEADRVRAHDPIKAARLDDAANELCAVLAESDANGPSIADSTS
jgi:hypothetical protein